VQVLHQQHEMHGIERRRLTVEVPIRTPGGLVDCVDQQSANTNCLHGLEFVSLHSEKTFVLGSAAPLSLHVFAVGLTVITLVARLL
jgi:hypothetical protein